LVVTASALKLMAFISTGNTELKCLVGVRLQNEMFGRSSLQNEMFGRRQFAKISVWSVPVY
jgi:hypothetical protein